MNNEDQRFNDQRLIKSSSNIFADLGFEPAEAEIMKLQAEIMLHTSQRIKEPGLTQIEAAKKLA